MGQAKKRGSFEERKAEAIARQKAEHEARQATLAARPKVKVAPTNLAVMLGLSAALNRRF